MTQAVQNTTVNHTDPEGMAQSARAKMATSFLRRGMFTATMSGVAYGNYTAFMTLAMTLGIWGVWYGDNSPLNDFSKLYLLGALGAATTDACSAIWAVGVALFKGKMGDFFRCLRSKPAAILIGAALIGGPLASTCYVLGLQSAGSIIVPISALCPAIGAILSRFLFKQPLTPRMLLGIAICFLASAIIGCTGLSDDAAPNLMLGLFFGFLAAFGWGLEGCVGGYASSLVDPEISITFRQVTSALGNLCILVPIFCLIGGESPLAMIGAAFADTSAMPFFAIGGFAAYYAFGLWYKGNAMCGTALGMACNGMFSFWGPFFCWVIIGLCFGISGYALAPIVWAAAVVMVAGIFIIAVNPLDFLRGDSNRKQAQPLNYALLKYMTSVTEACADDVLRDLAPEYGTFDACNKTDIQNALLMAVANGLLEETRSELDADNRVRIFFRAHEEGCATIKRYLGE